VPLQTAGQVSLDDIFRDSSKLNGLVIDVRLNHGGDDQLGIEIASRLTDRKYLAYAKAARNNLAGPLHFTAAQETWVVPCKRASFHGNVVLLIGPDTVSAGETFTMALLGREPHVSRIGLNTQGVFPTFLTAACQTDGGFDCPMRFTGLVMERLSTHSACRQIFVFPFFLVRTWPTAGT
jgi:hypothetical protein